MTATAKRTIAQPLKQLAISIAITGVVIAAAQAVGRNQGDGYVTPQWAIAIHLITVIPALPLGAYVLMRKKGDSTHRLLGKIWTVLMLVTAVDSFWIRQVNGGIGPIHIFSVVTLISLPYAIYQIRKGNVEAHLRAMKGTFIGLCAAGLFALTPGRTIWTFLFG